jgi:hypothetical protein
MSGKIKTDFDADLPGCIVTMSGTISLHMLEDWAREFEGLLFRRIEGDPVPLILDTGAHDFEHPQCLAFLRQLLSESAHVMAGISRAAFICPAHFQPPRIVSKVEAYFADGSAARAWIRREDRHAQPLYRPR